MPWESVPVGSETLLRYRNPSCSFGYFPRDFHDSGGILFGASVAIVDCLPFWVNTASVLCSQINLSKVGEYWWSAILEGEEQIDIDKINKERSMATVDEEEHAVLDRLSFDYHQKLQGKPQSHELVCFSSMPLCPLGQNGELL